jgi:hypothetical protein
VGQAQGGVLGDEGDVESPLAPVAHGRSDLLLGLADDHPHVTDARLGQGLQPVEEDRLVGHGDQLLRLRVGDRPQPAALPPCEDQTLHRTSVRAAQHRSPRGCATRDAYP